MEKFAVILAVVFVVSFFGLIATFICSDLVMRLAPKDSKLYSWWSKHICARIE